ncbi:MAG: hypothetical protein Q8Q25_02435, partial [bacterium]|nr:hypothetical protein [bacterium]
NTETGAKIHTLTEHTDWIKTLAFSPDGETLATGSTEKTAILWDLKQLNVFNYINAAQWKLLEAIGEAIKSKQRVQAKPEEWAVFESLPDVIKNQLRLYIRSEQEKAAPTPKENKQPKPMERAGKEEVE